MRRRLNGEGSHDSGEDKGAGEFDMQETDTVGCGWFRQRVSFAENPSWPPASLEVLEELMEIEGHYAYSSDCIRVWEAGIALRWPHHTGGTHRIRGPGGTIPVPNYGSMA